MKPTFNAPGQIRAVLPTFYPHYEAPPRSLLQWWAMVSEPPLSNRGREEEKQSKETEQKLITLPSQTIAPGLPMEKGKASTLNDFEQLDILITKLVQCVMT